jgi:hypothetical protein
MATDLDKAQTTAVGKVLDYASDAGAGFENADKDSYAIPFLYILQSNSPQCKKSDGKYIAGAEEGMIFNTVTEQVIDGLDGITVIPVHYERAFLEYGDRDKKDGGFYGVWAPDSERVLNTPVVESGDYAGKQVTAEGHILTDTRQHYVLIVNSDGTFSQAVIGMSSTQIKVSRTWMSKMEGIKLKRPDGTSFTPPMFSHQYKLTTIAHSNEQGSWMGWKVEALGKVEDANLYNAAKKFRQAIVAGTAKAKQDDNAQF